MSYHNESEEAFDNLLLFMSQKVPYIQGLKEALEIIIAK